MRSGNRKAWLGWIAVGLVGGLAGAAQAAPWDKLLTLNRVDADPQKTYALADTNGPWMIIACSFSGPKAEEQAQQLVLELRKRYKLPAYQYEKTFDVGKDIQGLGVDRYNNPRKMKLARGESEIREIAVLVGDYPTADDPEAQTTLKKLKYYQPECLKVEPGRETARTLAGWRAIQSYVLPADSDKKKKGPMGHAMITTNPKLPSEYFAPQGLDEVVIKANEGVEHSLLDCPGKYTVMVAHFTGRSKVVISQKDMEKELSILNRTKAEDSPLVEAAERAHNLTVALRKQGIEAYEFHDRSASIVTVGSFASYGNQGQDGTIELDPRILKIIEQYKAKSGAPQQLAGIAFDVQPKVVQIPKRPVTAAWARGAVRK